MSTLLLNKTKDELHNNLKNNNKQIIEYQKLIYDLEQKNKTIEKKIKDINDKSNSLSLNLNEQQKKAVEHTTTNSIIIACPGSGKTRVYG